MAAVEKEDPAQVRAAQILVSLRYRKLRRWPEWVPMPSGESSSSPGIVAAAKVMPSGEALSSGTVPTGVPLRRRPERVSMQSGGASLGLAGTVAAGVPVKWPKAKRSGSRGETSRELEQGHAAAAAKGSGAPRPSEEERYAGMPAASAQRPVVATLCYAAVAGSETGPSISAAPAKEPMKTPSPDSPDTPLDYGAGGSGAPSSADDAAPARRRAKRKGTGAARGSVGGEDEGCRSPAKRGPVAEEEKPIPISVEPCVQSETRAGKDAPLPFDFDLNLPWPLDEDDNGCPDTT